MKNALHMAISITMTLGNLGGYNALAERMGISVTRIWQLMGQSPITEGTLERFAAGLDVTPEKLKKKIIEVRRQAKEAGFDVPEVKFLVTQTEG